MIEVEEKKNATFANSRLFLNTNPELKQPGQVNGREKGGGGKG